MQTCVSIGEAISAGKPVTKDDLILIGQLPDANSSTWQFYTTLRTHLLSMQDDLVLSLLTLKVSGGERRSLDDLFSTCREVDTVEVHTVVASNTREVTTLDCFWLLCGEEVSTLLPTLFFCLWPFKRYVFVSKRFIVGAQQEPAVAQCGGNRLACQHF